MSEESNTAIKIDALDARVKWLEREVEKDKEKFSELHTMFTEHRATVTKDDIEQLSKQLSAISEAVGIYCNKVDTHLDGHAKFGSNIKAPLIVGTMMLIANGILSIIIAFLVK